MINIARRFALVLSSLVCAAACGGSAPPASDGTSAETGLKLTPQQPGTSEPEPTQTIVSSCKDDKVEQGSTVRLAGGGCNYRIATQPETAEYELSVSTRLTGGGSFALWPDGRYNPNQHSAHGTGIVYDVAASGFWFMRYGSESATALPKLGRVLDRDWHTWRVLRTRDRLIVWLDGQKLLAVNGPRTGGEMGFMNWPGTVLEVRDIAVKPLAPAEISAVNAERTTGWLAAGTATASRTGSAPKPDRIVNGCNIDEIDWKNRTYAASKLSKTQYTLVQGVHRLTSTPVKPDPLMTLGMSEQGTELRFGGAFAKELDGQAPAEVAVSISFGDFGIWHGNSPPPAQPETTYVYRLSATCEPTELGAIDLEADDTVRFENDALVRIRGSGNAYTVEDWRVAGHKFQRVSSRKAGREALEPPRPPCDQAKSLAALAGFEGRNGGDLLQADSCVALKLEERLGAHREEFEAYTSMGLSPLEKHGDRLLSGGCRVRVCGFQQAAFSVDIKTGHVDAVIVSYSPKPTITSVKWITPNSKPTPALQAFVNAGLERLR